MPKTLALLGLVAAALILVLVVVDIATVDGSWAMRVIYMLCALGLGALSFLTMKEQSK